MTVAMPTSGAARRGSFRRQRSRSSRPGVSLMAQGEPMIWLTGGGLATCVAMIVGLLGLVLFYGIPTFWPSPVILLEKVNGHKVLGEVARRESYVIDASNLPSLSDEEVNAARQLLQQNHPPTTGRCFLRTGNFELTGEHFQWVFDFAVKPGGESLPEWAVVVERVEWGRFYGVPKQFSLRHPRPIVGEEQEYQTILQFVDVNRSRVPADQAESLDKAIAPVRERLENARRANVAKFLASFADRQDVQLTFVLSDGQTRSPKEHQPGENIVEVRESWLGENAAWQQFLVHHDTVRARFRQQHLLGKHEIGRVNDQLEHARLAVRKQELQYHVAAEGISSELGSLATTETAIEQTARDVEAVTGTAAKTLPADSSLLAFVRQFAQAQEQEINAQRKQPNELRQELQSKKDKLPPPARDAVDRYLVVLEESELENAKIQSQITELNATNSLYELTLTTAEGQDKALALSSIVRAYAPNRLSWWGKLGVYSSRWWEYLSTEPREANSEGGVMPAIWGTVAMTLVMSLLVVPFGVLAALYLREYARTGVMVSVLRIAISNLAGVPSIVFGVFGLGFFCYLVGAYIDGGPANAGITPLVPKTWWLLLVVLAVAALGAFGLGLYLLAGPRGDTRASRRRWGYLSLFLWMVALTLALALIFATPYFHGLFAASLPNPTFGKGGLIWASLTLALLTLPVVIVATEEALSAVPNSLREGSYACGASKWQTIRRIILPHAMPGIMTGMILAMARGAGEVAPLMLVGAVKMQPELPLDGEMPFLHLQRSFMHLGFHIFDLGFQSQNPDAAKPMVFTTTMLLIGIVAVLNLVAVWVRSRLRQRFQMGQF